MSDFRERAKISIANSSRYIQKGRKQTPSASAAFDTNGGLPPFAAGASTRGSPLGSGPSAGDEIALSYGAAEVRPEPKLSTDGPITFDAKRRKPTSSKTEEALFI
jgi:hypothetical protein